MRTLLIAGLLSAAVAVPVLAQPTTPPAPPQPMAAKVMTRADVDAKVRAHFARADANRDGFVTADEMTARRGARMAQRDARRSQRTDRTPKRDPNAAFDRIDANHDGVISRAEFAAGRELRIEKRVALHGAMRGKHHAGGMGMMGGHLLKMADANRDGRVSLAEATAGAMQHFDRVDTDRDGRITPDERRAGRARMKQPHAPVSS